MTEAMQDLTESRARGFLVKAGIPQDFPLLRLDAGGVVCRRCREYRDAARFADAGREILVPSCGHVLVEKK